MATDTTAPSYWLNWRFLLCAIWITASMIFSALIIWRYEGQNASRSRANGDQREAAGGLNKGDSWATCSRSIRPIWLLVFRIVAFCALLSLILADTILHGVGIFYYYTEWTFTLVTIYFGIGSSLSILGCLHYCNKVDSKSGHSIVADAERGEDADMQSTSIILNNYDYPTPRTASIWEYTFQIMFQMCAGAVVLTDSVYWLVLYPFFTAKDDTLTFLDVGLHSVNAVFLLGDLILNSLRFPFFRFAYFVLWTCIFVIFQWIIHVFVSMSWPYTFLDLSSSYAPLWYLAVGLMHIPCYGVFYLVFKIKQRYLSR